MDHLCCPFLWKYNFCVGSCEILYLLGVVERLSSSSSHHGQVDRCPDPHLNKFASERQLMVPLVCWLSSHLFVLLFVVWAMPILISISRIQDNDRASHMWRSSRRNGLSRGCEYVSPGPLTFHPLLSQSWGQTVHFLVPHYNSMNSQWIILAYTWRQTILCVMWSYLGRKLSSLLYHLWEEVVTLALSYLRSFNPCFIIFVQKVSPLALWYLYVNSSPVPSSFVLAFVSRTRHHVIYCAVYDSTCLPAHCRDIYEFVIGHVILWENKISSHWLSFILKRQTKVITLCHCHNDIGMPV